MPLLDDEHEIMNDEEKARIKKEGARMKSSIAKEYNHIVVKLKEKNFFKAVVSSTRSGCGKIVYEFYEKLVIIWGVSGNTDRLYVWNKFRNSE